MKDARLRPAEPGDLPALSDLCLRSKAHWGYDAAFLEACRDPLTLSSADLANSRIVMLEVAGAPVGVVQLCLDGAEAELGKLFVDPGAMGAGYGRQLMGWAVETARTEGAQEMRIEADPGAVLFYERMGASQTGWAPSEAIPGRKLPVLTLVLG